MVLGIQDSRTRDWIHSIVVNAGFAAVLKEGPEDLIDLGPDGSYHFVIAETGLDAQALDILYGRQKQQFEGHWDEITVLGILLRPVKDEGWWFKWFADNQFDTITNIASRDWNEWRLVIPGGLRAIDEALRSR